VSCITSIPAWRKTLRTGTTSWFGGLKSLPHKYIKLQLVLLLFFSYFSTRTRFVVRKYYSCGYVINCPVDSVESPFGCSPLFYYNYWPVSKFRDCSTKLLLEKNITPECKYTKQKETFMPDLSGQSGRRYIIRQAS
jgi:hypothetical protein